jgi:hypothetical protein
MCVCVCVSVYACMRVCLCVCVCVCVCHTVVGLCPLFPRVEHSDIACDNNEYRSDSGRELLLDDSCLLCVIDGCLVERRRISISCLGCRRRSCWSAVVMGCLPPAGCVTSLSLAASEKESQRNNEAFGKGRLISPLVLSSPSPFLVSYPPPPSPHS